MDHSPTKVNLNNICLALEGGGIFGAFIWGVLDRLLDEPDFSIEGISAASAGALNAALLVSGFASGGQLEAKRVLRKFWEELAVLSPFTPFQRGTLDRLMGHWSLSFSIPFVTHELMARLISPYLNMNLLYPLKELLINCIDFESLTKTKLKLFVFTTHIASGESRVFTNEEITADVLIASSSIPTLFPATIIENEAYWDGGLTGNPSLKPLVQECRSKDVILIQINPQKREPLPVIASHVMSRINEIALSVRLATELDFIQMLKEQPQILSGEALRWAELGIHSIYDNEVLELDYSTKFNSEFAFTNFLFDKGRAAAEQFLSAS